MTAFHRNVDMYQEGGRYVPMMRFGFIVSTEQLGRYVQFKMPDLVPVLDLSLPMVLYLSVTRSLSLLPKATRWHELCIPSGSVPIVSPDLTYSFVLELCNNRNMDAFTEHYGYGAEKLKNTVERIITELKPHRDDDRWPREALWWKEVP